MQISSFSDLTLRILICLGMQSGRSVSTREIADALDLSFDHLAKAAQLLSRHGFVIASRGRGGGMRLARDPIEISIGKVVRLTEAGSGLVECLRPGPVQCKLNPVCCLKGILSDANEAFFASLDNKTLADALPNPKMFRRHLDFEPPPKAQPERS
ncbi:MAG: Rrf2 family transcriptional regulator [Alphaproteobacteria bacterium]|nr:Rrf2 family transcriptional regulator [Alphaproteobacteria bacterium]